MGWIFYQMLNHSNFKQSSEFLTNAKNEFLRYRYCKIVDPDVPDHDAYFPGWKEVVIKMIDKDPNRRLSVALLIMKERVRMSDKVRNDENNIQSVLQLYPDVFWFDSKYDPNRKRD